MTGIPPLPKEVAEQAVAQYQAFYRSMQPGWRRRFVWIRRVAFAFQDSQRINDGLKSERPAGRNRILDLFNGAF